VTLLTGESKFDQHHHTIGVWLTRIANANDPRTTTGEAVASANKPESKDPGRQQCPGAVRRAIAILERAERDLAACYDAAKIREHHEEPAQVMGGVNVAATEEEHGAMMRGAYRGPLVAKLVTLSSGANVKRIDVRKQP
jgi:hypothetical protein